MTSRGANCCCRVLRRHLARCLTCPCPIWKTKGCPCCGTGSISSTGPRRPTSARTGTPCGGRCRPPPGRARAGCGLAAASRPPGRFSAARRPPGTAACFASRTSWDAQARSPSSRSDIRSCTTAASSSMNSRTSFTARPPRRRGTRQFPRPTTRLYRPWDIEISPTLLFRFSALTYNAHRIHYDRDYARDAEGYPGLLTHGPLQALAMAEAARATGYGSQASLDFQYRLESPLFDYQGMIVKAVRGNEAVTTAVRDGYGRQTASGTLHSPGE